MARLVIGTDKTATTPAVVIEKGIVPTGTLSITQNGTYDVTQYASADVNTPAAPAHYIEKSVDANGVINNTSNFINLVGVNEVGNSGLSYAYINNQQIISIDMSSIKKINSYGCQGMFQGCINLTSANLNLLEEIGLQGCNNMFSSSGVTTANLPLLKKIGNSGAFDMYNSCVSLTSANLSSVEQIDSQGCFRMFASCRNLTSLSFPALKTVANATVFQNMLLSVTGCTVHFPSNLSSYNFNCGGTNTTVLYDLPATE